jgi:hypothetical protein
LGKPTSAQCSPHLCHVNNVAADYTDLRSTDWEQAPRARFNQARDDEYGEIVENVERLEDEIRGGTRKGRLTFAQLEDIEADLEKLQRWTERITKRDFFRAPGRAAAEAALARGATALEAFAQAVYEHECVQERASVQQEPEHLPDQSAEGA